jgi:hypothetical protein
MSEVAQDLSKRTERRRVSWTRTTKELLSIEFSELTLEPALQLLSPSVYVDYEIDTGSRATENHSAFSFTMLNQGEPPLTQWFNGSNAVDAD